MGLGSFISSLWRTSTTSIFFSSNSSSHSTSTTSSRINTSKLSSSMTSPPTLEIPNHTDKLPTTKSPLSSITKKSTPSPKTPQYVTFILSGPLYQWLEAMAVIHNYGSVHKSIRDLLAWACAGQDDDLEWMFLKPHEIPYRLHYDTDVDDIESEVTSIANKQASPRVSKDDPVVLDARISEHLLNWINSSVQKFGLSSPSDVLEAVCKCAIELKAANDVFESHIPARGLATSTIDLYHDLGLIRFPNTACKQ